MRRRDLLIGAGALPLASALGSLAAGEAFAQAGKPVPFSAAQVRQMARELASKSYNEPDTSLPESLRDLPYDLYRDIRFLPEKALWRDAGVPFQIQLFHRGFLYSNRVQISLVENGEATPVVYSPDFFSYGRVPPQPANLDLGFAGFRLHGPMNRPDYFDEIVVFLGASYFRAIARDQIYGLSARGLAIKTADASGEEFPAWRAFWIEKPAPNINSVVVHALLDSESAAAAFRFTVKPGDITVIDVEAALYPRTDIDKGGLAPLTSMFFFDANDRVGVNDFRPGVHDSDGLAMWNGRGERLWRPLINPDTLQISDFYDTNPRGFGLMQRQRDFHDFEDLEARYEKRPSLWIEPIGDWGEGAVQLIEIPTKEEIHDNIVAYWRPKGVLSAKGEYLYNYRMHWSGQNPSMPPELASFHKTRIGLLPNDEDRRLFVIDAIGGRLKDIPLDEQVRAMVSTNYGTIEHVVVQPNPESGGWRLSFRLVPSGEPVVELRAQLLRGEDPLSEVWVYRWMP